jgi:DNA-binding CsgD family transcriptional regulator
MQRFLKERVSRKTSELSNLGTSELLIDILKEISDPLAVISKDRRIVFTSASFDDLIGIEGSCVDCDQVLVPAFEGIRNICCWDVLDLFVRTDEPGIWLIKKENKDRLAVLSRVYPIDLRGKHMGIAIKVKPLLFCKDLEMHEKVLMRSITDAFKGTKDIRMYLRFLTRLINDHLSPRFICWITADANKGIEILSSFGKYPEGVSCEVLLKTIGEALPTVNCAIPFDLIVEKKIFHIFPGIYGKKGLILVMKGIRSDVEPSDIKAVNLIVNTTTSLVFGYEGSHGNMALNPLTIDILTDREREIISLIAKGLSDKEIARALHISPYTVKNHVSSAMLKTGFTKRTQLVALLMQYQFPCR